MISPDSMDAYLGFQLIELFPETIKSELLSNSDLMKKMGIETDVIIGFSDQITFSRKSLFKVVRDVFSEPSTYKDLIDNAGCVWHVSNTPGNDLKISITNQDKNIINSDFWPLHPDISKRIEQFGKLAYERNFSEEELVNWRSILSSSSINDSEVADLILDLENTPSYIISQLRQEFRAGSNQVATLVPTEMRYYERLIGKYCKSKNIEEYCDNELSHYFENRIKKEIDENDFLMCMHTSISKSLSHYFSDDLIFQSIASRAIETRHPILLISCLEIGLYNFRESSNLIIEKLFSCMSSSETRENLNLFCSMVIFVDGELARLRLFADAPPFYRRLASLAQSALIVKVVLEDGVEFEDIRRWASQERGMYFLCQNILDLSNEPRWLPGYLTADQFINELYGRLNNACQTTEICDIVEHLKLELLSETRLNLQWFLPGPLEGNSTPAVIPEEILNLLNKDITEESSLKAYKVLINSALFWKIDDEHLERVISLLESAQHNLSETTDTDTVYQVLNGLAQVSCMTKNNKIAASVMMLSRIYRDYIDVDSDPVNYFALGLVAGAAFQDRDSWSEYIGSWCTELAYLPLNEGSIVKIRFMLEVLCTFEPFLYHSCSKALDIFKALSSKQ